MKKLLGIVLIILLFCTNVYAKKIKNGSGSLNLSENDVETFHIYLTKKLSRDGMSPSYDGKTLPGFHGGSPEKSVYGDYFLIVYDNQPYIWAWGSSINRNPGTTLKIMTGGNPDDYKIFAKKKKIVWKGAKKKISKDITLDELKLILKELGFYN